MGLVDDHEVIRSGMREFLKSRKDIQVVAEASDGIEAIRMVRDQRIDVVVLDLNMPKHDGVTTLAGIRAASPSTGVLIFSGMPAKTTRSILLSSVHEDISPKTVALRKLSRPST